MKAVGNSEVGLVEGFIGGGKEKRNRQTGVIIGEILCFLLLQNFPMLLAPCSFSLLNFESPTNRGIRRSVTSRLGLYVTTIRLILAYPNCCRFK